MATNKMVQRGKALLYACFLTKFTWHKKVKQWKYRMRGRAIGKINHVHPAARELYCLCLLHNEIKCAMSYEDLQTINGTLYATYRESCFAPGILGDDSK